MSALEVLNRSKPADKRKKCALGIMTKAPVAGKVKTRLSPPLTLAEAAELNVCFLRDISCAIELVSQDATAQGVGIYTPVGSEAIFESILPGSFALILQRGENFGERLAAALDDLLSVGFDSVCLINSDSPTVAASSFREAATELSKPGDRIVLGPSDDGGYYLIGLKKPHLRVFEGIEWSTERVFDQTMEHAREIGTNTHLLPSGFDVDDGLTLKRLCRELLGSEPRADLAPATTAFLRRIVETEGKERIWPDA